MNALKGQNKSCQSLKRLRSSKRMKTDGRRPNRIMTFQDELRALFYQHQIEYEERYVGD